MSAVIDFDKSRRIPRLTDRQTIGLLWLKLGWPFGMDGRTMRALKIRGIVRVEFDTLGPNDLPWDRPVLTRQGMAIANGLARAMRGEYEIMRRALERDWGVKCTGDGTVTICRPDSPIANDNEEI